jgi:hypothetical protein
MAFDQLFLLCELDSLFDYDFSCFSENYSFLKDSDFCTSGLFLKTRLMDFDLYPKAK